ncbi:MAG: TIGR01906 family membrane protein [Dehalococcoidia bacterium]
MNLVPRAASVLFIVALPVFLISANIRFFAGEAWFYERGFREHDAVASTGLSLSELDRSAGEIRDYFVNDARYLNITVVEDGVAVPLYNEQEVLHMADVKRVMQVLFRLNEVALAIVLATVAGRFLWAREGDLRRLARDTLYGLALGALAAGAIGILAIVGFDSAWDRFHEIVFTNDFWQLNPATDRLIQMFPESYWQESVVMIAVMVVTEGAGLAVLAGGYLWFTRTPGPAEVRSALPEPGPS